MVEKSIALVLKKAVFERLMRQALAMSRPVRRNVVQTLQERLVGSRAQRKVAQGEFLELEAKLQRIREETEKLRGGG